MVEMRIFSLGAIVAYSPACFTDGDMSVPDVDDWRVVAIGMHWRDVVKRWPKESERKSLSWTYLLQPLDGDRRRQVWADADHVFQWDIAERASTVFYLRKDPLPPVVWKCAVDTGEGDDDASKMFYS